MRARAPHCRRLAAGSAHRDGLPAELALIVLMTGALAKAGSLPIRTDVLGAFVFTRFTIAVGPFPEGLGVPEQMPSYAYINEFASRPRTH